MKDKSGFTLMELMVVIAIIGILAGIAIPNVISWRNNQQVMRAARGVYSTLQAAKMSAINDNATINVLFSPGEGSSGRYRAFEDINGNNTYEAAVDRSVSSGQMPPGINMSGAAFAAAVGANSTRFTPLGMTTGANGRVTVTNGSLEVQVVVNQGGGVRIE